MFSRLSSTLLVGTAVLGTAIIGLGSGSAKAAGDEVCRFDDPFDTIPVLPLPAICGSNLVQDDTTFMSTNNTYDNSGIGFFPGTVTFTPNLSVTVEYIPPAIVIPQADLNNGDPGLTGLFEYTMSIDPALSTDVFTSVALSGIQGTGVLVTKQVFKYDPVNNVMTSLGEISAGPGGNATLPILFSAAITDLYIIDAITGNGTITSYTNSYTQFTQTPAPLPLLGAGAAFGFSRRLRRRTRTRLTLV